MKVTRGCLEVVAVEEGQLSVEVVGVEVEEG